jgi:hypothetical protein
MKQTIFTIFALILSMSIYAQAPQAFNYQGVARDLSGNPIISQVIGLQIAILQGSSSGVEIYKETHIATTTNLGLFNLQIGTGDVVTGDFEGIDWGSDGYFLQIALDENGGSNYELVGTSELLSVPYALYAKNVENSKWIENNDTIYTVKNVSIGTASPQTSAGLTIQRNSIGNNGRAGIVLRNLSDDFLSFTSFTISSGSEDNRASGILSTYAKSYTGVFGYDGYTMLSSPDRGTVLRADNPEGNIRFVVGGTGLLNEKMHINADGNVGIGTSDPEAKLHITGNSNQNIIRFPGDWNLRYDEGATSPSQGGFDLSNPDSENLTFYKFEGDQITDPVTAIQFSNKNTIFGVSQGAGNFSLPEAILVVNDDQNIGIGTFEPKSKLQVSNGDIYIENIDNGVIMKSPNGQCWRMTVNNSGQPEFNAITCPD